MITIKFKSVTKRTAKITGAKRMHEASYALGDFAPRYPVPAIKKINPLIEAYICRDLYRWLNNY